jgi:predicted DNA-binding transcriptional regulator YafY
LANVDPGGILTPHIQPLMARLNALLGAADNTAEEIRKRILIVGQGKRHMKIEHFERVGSALLRRKRMVITYFARGKGETTEREVSPQRLVHYRENWYLDAWCHLRDELRNFAVDSISRVEVLEKKAKDVSRTSMDQELGPGYGIFTGHDVQYAKLKFTPERARWVAQESWHPKQRGILDPDGSYTLEVPYADDRELLMDILKFGNEVEVQGPASLKKRVKTEIDRMSKRYS